MDPVDLLARSQGFDWDEGNAGKNRERHGVEFWECEEIFFNQPLVLGADTGHSTKEEARYYCLGRTDAGRRLFVVFTARGELLRVISARDMSRKERREYRRHEGNPDL